MHNLAQTSIVQKGWKQSGSPMIHGWVYDIRTGLIKDIINLGSDSVLDDIYTFDFSDLNNSQYSEDSDI